MSIEFTITIASVPEREEVVAELWYGEALWSVLSRDGGPVMLTLYPNPAGGPWTFTLDDAVTHLEEARRQLVGGTGEEK